VLQCVAVLFQCDAACCNAVFREHAQLAALSSRVSAAGMLQCGAVWCSAEQCGAVCCMLRCDAMCCNAVLCGHARCNVDVGWCVHM